MAKVRVFELAKDLNMPSKDLVTLLNELGVKAKNHMSAIDENAARYVMRKYGPDAVKGEAKASAPAGAPVVAPTPIQPGQLAPVVSECTPAAGSAPAQTPTPTPIDMQLQSQGQRAPYSEAAPVATGTGAGTGHPVQPGIQQPFNPQHRIGPSQQRPAPYPQQTQGPRSGDFGPRPDGRQFPQSQGRPMQGPRSGRPLPGAPAGGQAGQVSQVQRPLDPSYPFIPARQGPRPFPQGGAPRPPRPVGQPVQPGQAWQQGPSYSSGQARPMGPSGGPRPMGGPGAGMARPYGPRPTGSAGAGARRGPGLSVPPPPQTATPAPPSRGAKGKSQWTGRGRRGELGEEGSDRPSARADKRGRKKAPTSAPLDDARLIGRRIVSGEMDIDSEDEVGIKRSVRRREKAAKVKRVEIGSAIAVRDLAAKLEIPASEVVSRLIRLGVMVNINQEIEGEVAQILATDLGFEAELTSEREEREVAIAQVEDSEESLKPRPPVVTIMGHVDHGKTSLLDAIRETNVTATEAGGITQHIGAYQVELRGRKITFLDTPGHEAFTAMRARGAQVTDVAVLVVAADDGVMPQTIEAVNHARDAKVPIVVAINKIDRPGAQPERVQRQLAEIGLVSEEWGGDTVMAPVSALRRQGIEDLLEMILLVADMRDIKANPDRPAWGTVVEARIDRGRGPVATVLIQKGTLKVGDNCLVGETFGRVRAMADYIGQSVEVATPSMPVEVLGLSEVPEAGDVFQVVTDEREAKQVAERRADRRRQSVMKDTKKVSLEDLFSQIKEGEVKELRVVIKADVQGSVEAVRQALEKLSTSEVRVNVIHGGVGAVSEWDVMLASASNAIVIGFNVRPDGAAANSAEIEQVDVRLYRVIYDAIDDVKKAMEGLLEPEFREVVYGHAEVRETFKVPKVGVVAGCYITDGKVTRSARVRLIRDGVVAFEGKIASLKRFKDDAREVAAGFECGIGIENWNDIREKDIIEAFGKEEVKREL